MSLSLYVCCHHLFNALALWHWHQLRELLQCQSSVSNNEVDRYHPAQAEICFTQHNTGNLRLKCRYAAVSKRATHPGSRPVKDSVDAMNQQQKRRLMHTCSWQVDNGQQKTSIPKHTLWKRLWFIRSTNANDQALQLLPVATERIAVRMLRKWSMRVTISSAMLVSLKVTDQQVKFSWESDR